MKGSSTAPKITWQVNKIPVIRNKRAGGGSRKTRTKNPDCFSSPVRGGICSTANLEQFGSSGDVFDCHS